MKDLTFTDERVPLVVHYDIELDDAGLDPYAFRAYQRIARRCAGATTGKCNESLESMATACQMSRAQMTKSIRVLIQRRMIARNSKTGCTSHYALLDKKHWLSLEKWQQTYVNPATTEPPTRLPDSQEVATIKPGVATTKPGGGYQVATKKTNEEYKEEREEDSLSVASLILSTYEEVATDYKTQTRLKEQIIQLNGASVAQVEKWLASRRELSTINYIAQDFKTWLANQKRKAQPVSNPLPSNACSSCQDSGSISVFVGKEFSHYADCPKCQPVAEAA